MIFINKFWKKCDNVWPCMEVGLVPFFIHNRHQRFVVAAHIDA